MAAGQLLWVVGDGVDSWLSDVAHVDTFPSIADAFYLAAYPAPRRSATSGWALPWTWGAWIEQITIFV